MLDIHVANDVFCKTFALIEGKIARADLTFLITQQGNKHRQKIRLYMYVSTHAIFTITTHTHTVTHTHTHIHVHTDCQNRFLDSQ